MGMDADGRRRGRPMSVPADHWLRRNQLSNKVIAQSQVKLSTLAFTRDFNSRSSQRLPRSHILNLVNCHYLVRRNKRWNWRSNIGNHLRKQQEIEQVALQEEGRSWITFVNAGRLVLAGGLQFGP